MHRFAVVYRGRRLAGRRLAGRRLAGLVAFVLAVTALGCSVERSAALDDALALLDAGDDIGAADGETVAGTADAVSADAAPRVDTGCPLGAPCDDGDPCTSGDLCAELGCVGPLPTDCDDDDPCTDDRCDPEQGCVHAPSERPDCLAPRACETSCDDADPCTIDACDEAEGVCVHEAIADCRSCDPGGSWASDCDDRDEGTTDTCELDVVLGGSICLHRPRPCGLSPDACDDGDPCTQDVLGADCLCHYTAADC